MATIIEAEIKLIAEKAIKQVTDLNLELENVKKQINDTRDAQLKAEKSSRSFGKALGEIGKAGGIIFLVTKAFELLKQAINSNQQVADTFKVVVGTINQIFVELARILVNVYNDVTSTTDGFDALGKVMKGILDVVLTPFKLVWDGIKLGLLEAQLAWEESFFGSGDTSTIDKLNDSIKQTRQDIGETLDTGAEGLKNIVENFGEAVTEVGDAGSKVVEKVGDISVKAIAENVKANVFLRKSAERARIANQGLIEEYDRQAEQQRQIRDNDLKSIDERIAANDKLKTTLEDQKEKMIENADLIIKQAEEQFKLSGLEEDYLLVLAAKNEKKAVEAQIEGFMSEQEANRTALLKERIELGLAEDAAVANRQNIQREFNAEMEENEVTRLQMQLDNLEADKIIEEERLKFKRDQFKQGTQAYIDANNELLDYQQANANEQKKIEKSLGLAKEAQLKQTLGNIATIVGKNSKFGKAIAIVQALQDTYAGANKALAQGGLFGFIGAAAVIAAGIANVKQIASTKSPEPPAGIGARSTGGGTPSVAAPTPPPVPSLPPQFNLTSGGGANALATALGEQQQTPIQAYVVSGDVSTAQELERNIITGATLG